MKITLVNQFYEPDIAPTGKILHDLGKFLIKQGHTVHVICSARSYIDSKQRFAKHEKLDGVFVHRLWTFGFERRNFFGKLLDYLLFFTQASVCIFFYSLKTDLFISLTTPPYIGLPVTIAATLFRKKCFHWIMDLYPDALFANKSFSRQSFSGNILFFLTKKMFLSSNGILTIGPCMQKRIESYFEKEGKKSVSTTWIPLWSTHSIETIDAEDIKLYREKFNWFDDQIVLMYSGNMGLGHRFKEFLKAAEITKDDRKYRWVFFGGGKRYSEIKEYIQSKALRNAEIHPYVENDVLEVHLHSADVHLVSLNKEWQGILVPSKIQSIFAVGKPVIFIGDKDNSIAQWIERAGAGWIVSENDIKALVDTLEIISDPQIRNQKGRAAQRFYRQHFNKNINCLRICEFIGLLPNNSPRNSKEHPK